MGLLAEVCAGNAPRLRDALAGVRAYQDNPWHRDLAPQPEIARNGTVALRDYGGEGPFVVFVPSLINPPTVLDIEADNSLLRWLATQGVRPLLVDWGDAELAGGLDAVITDRLHPLLRSIDAPFAIAGYCLGGVLALGVASLIPPTRIALLATPWHFDRYSEPALDQVAAHIASVTPLAETLNCLPMELLQPMFWALDREAVASKFILAGSIDPLGPRARAFAALEDWANEGPPLSLQMTRDVFGGLFAGNSTGRGEWQVGGVPVHPDSLGVPILDIVAMRDRIVPPATALGQGTRLELDAGHVGMIVGSRARATLWQPLAQWLRAD